MGTEKRKKPNRKKGAIDYPFIPLRVELISSFTFASLSPNAMKLLFALYSQLRPTKGDPAPNNGDLSVARSILKNFGFGSQHTITRAKNELLAKGLIEVTSYGLPCKNGKKANLYGLTLFPIGECGGKLDVKPTHYASNDWRQFEPANLTKIKSQRAKSASTKEKRTTTDAVITHTPEQAYAN